MYLAVRGVDVSNLLCACPEIYYVTLCTRPQRWSIFQGDGMVNVFFGPPLPSMVFNGFDKVGPSPLNVFWGVQPLEPMVFRWFSKF